MIVTHECKRCDGDSPCAHCDGIGSITKDWTEDDVIALVEMSEGYRLRAETWRRRALKLEANERLQAVG